MKKLNMYNGSVWVKLTPNGLAHLTEWCNSISVFSKDQEVAGQQMIRFSKRGDGWFEFSPCTLMAIFGELVGDKGKEIPFEGNEIFTECPYEVFHRASM